jgi:hypothetical protein
MTLTVKKSGLAALTAVAAVLALGSGTGYAAPPGPTVTYDPHPGGITAHIESNSWLSVDCGYTADGWVHRNLHLPAFGRTDLEFPGIPLFHQWNVTVRCDDGAVTHLTYWY